MPIVYKKSLKEYTKKLPFKVCISDIAKYGHYWKFILAEEYYND